MEVSDLQFVVSEKAINEELDKVNSYYRQVEYEYASHVPLSWEELTAALDVLLRNRYPFKGIYIRRDSVCFHFDGPFDSNDNPAFEFMNLGHAGYAIRRGKTDIGGRFKKQQNKS